MTSKYTPLEHYLRGIPVEQKDVTLTFEQIERILNDKLPPSAQQYPAWWANEKDGQHVHAHSWLNAGWRKDMVNFTNKWVRFIRIA